MVQKWFKEAKLGIFIHWGIYSVNGISESWSFADGSISYDDYMKQLDGFTASKYDPKKWAKLFKATGANYAVLTTKHHDGVALFDTKHTDLTVSSKTPAGRDLVKSYCEAMQDEGIESGLYFTNTDWSDIDNMQVILDKSREEIIELRKEKNKFVDIWVEACKHDENDTTQDTAELKMAWERFMQRYRLGISELLANYGDVGLLWFDVMLTRKGFSWETKKVRDMISEINPRTMVNGRLMGQGDYKTPELYIPLSSPGEEWELCTTFNDSWGYQPNDKNYKDIKQIVRMFGECISKGGNLLISIGPTPEGEIPKETEEIMLKLGEWTHKYYEAIYPTEKGIEPDYFLGGSTLSHDKKTLYLFSYDKPNEFIMLNGIRNKNMKVTSLKNNRELSYKIAGGAQWINMPGQIWIDILEDDIDDVCTVIKIEFDEEIDMVGYLNSAESVGGL
ncbi:MAG: alpha-L-fucosidase [Oscillospiraceae bacterium]